MMTKFSDDKNVRRFLRKAYRIGHAPALAKPSLMEQERLHCGEEDYEYFTEYGFLPEKYYGKSLNDLSDDQLKDWVEENMVERVNSPYDCTGQRVTCWISWHRNPCGRISYVHRLGIDV